MSWASWVRVAVLTLVALLFALSLLAIVITGPVVVGTPEAEPVAAVSAERLQRSVETLVGELGPLDYTRVDNLDRAAAWIEGRFREAGLEVEFQDYQLREGRFRNVIARQPGRDSDLPAIVIGAHYDTYGGFPGADDNASGVAVLLELARTLPDAVPRSDHYLVAFGTEEPPFFGTDDMGSYRFAQLLRQREIEVELMIALDMVGVYSDRPGSQHFPVAGLGLFYPDTANFIAVVGNLGSGISIQRVKQGLQSTETLPVHSFRAPAIVDGVDWSDHRSFWRMGYPGVLVTDTSFMRYPYYHTRNDTPDRLDYRRMGALVNGLHVVLQGSYVQP